MEYSLKGVNKCQERGGERGSGGRGGGTGKKKHIALIDPDVFELAMVDDF